MIVPHIIERIKTITYVSTRVSDRIFVDKIPQDQRRPSIVLTVIDMDNFDSLDVGCELERITLQIDCYSNLIKESYNMARAIKNDFKNFRSLNTTPSVQKCKYKGISIYRYDKEDASDSYYEVTSIDYDIFFSEAAYA